LLDLKIGLFGIRSSLLQLGSLLLRHRDFLPEIPGF
jgi:hypothetical protein